MSKMKSMIKKSLAIITLILQFSSMGYAFENKQVDVYNDYVKITGNIKTARENDVVTLVVLSKDVNFTDIENILSEETASLVKMFYDVKVDSSGNYTFYFSPDEGGRYYGFLNTKSNKDDAHKFSFVYINEETFNEVKIAESEELASVLFLKGQELGLTGELYDNLEQKDYNTLAKILKNDAYTKETFNDSADRAALIVNLNNKETKDIYSYIGILGLEAEDAEYFNEEISKEVTQMVSGRNFESVNEFEDSLGEAIILCNVNDASAEKILKLLSDYQIGNRTLNLNIAKAVKKSAPYDSLEEIEEEIEAYSESSSSGGGGGSASSGGGWKGNSNIIQGTISTPVTPSKPNETVSFAFDDIESVSWAKEAIEELYKKEVISGKELRRFYPQDNVTREEFAKIIALAFELNLIDDEFPFSDVAEKDWFYPYVKSTYLAGIVNGIGDNKFGVGMNITRQDLCVMVYRAILAGNDTLSGDRTKIFDDEEQISFYAKEAVEKLVESGIISGDDNNRFNPQSFATRAEAAKIVYLALQQKK